MSFSINTPFIHEFHTILVVAETDGVFSRNTKTTGLHPSTSDPIVKDDVNIVGVVVPSERLMISLSSDNVLDFMGPVRSEHLNLEVGDFINGFTSDFQYFFLRITEVVISSDEKVLLITEEGRLEDIFDSLSYEAISRPDKVELTPSSLKRHNRHLIAKMRVQRKLCIWAWWCDNIEKPIGDFFDDVKDGFEDAWNFLKNGNLEKSVEIVNMRQELETKYPNEYYANPLPDASGAIQQPRFENVPRSNVEGCCWWGRGVIQTTGRCNFGKLNKSIGAGANQDSLYLTSISAPILRLFALALRNLNGLRGFSFGLPR